MPDTAAHSVPSEEPYFLSLYRLVFKLHNKALVLGHYLHYLGSYCKRNNFNWNLYKAQCPVVIVFVLLDIVLHALWKPHC